MSGKSTKICPVCGKEFTHRADRDRTYCSMKCFRESQKAYTTCPTCGKEFTHKPSIPRKFCSRKCQIEGGWKPSDPSKKETKNCPACGKEFTFYKCWPQETCSMECRNKHFHANKTVTTICPECGQEFTYHKSWPRKYCSRVCAAKNVITNIPTWKPTAYKTTCEQCGETYETTPASTKGRFCSKNCYYEWFRENAPAGPDSPNWKGGYESYYGPNWNRQRRKSLQRANHRCEHCGLTERKNGQSLDVHHLIPFRYFGYVPGENENYKLANKLENLLCLCKKCHKLAEHGKIAVQPHLL